MPIFTPMKRRAILKLGALTAASITLKPFALFAEENPFKVMSRSDFGKDFLFGTATAAAQIEGAWNEDGKGLSVWDVFSEKEGKIKDGSTNKIACNFYHKYPEDLQLMQDLGFDVFRFSTAWSRILPYGTKHVNQRGIDFYNRIIDATLEKGMQPWLTLYHWDMPQILENQGGWTNRDVVDWFGEYVDICARNFGDRVANWMVFNEPLAFTSLGYLLGTHAPGKIGVKNFLKSSHHTTLCQAEGGRILRSNLSHANIGTTFSASAVEAKTQSPKNLKAAKTLDAFLNRMFVEPALGMGYPTEDLALIRNIDKYMLPGDEEKIKFDFNFFGVQNYFRTVAKHSALIPILWANLVKAEKLVEDKETQITEMGWEVSPEGIYRILKQFNAYGKPLYVTENGAAFKDSLNTDGSVHDPLRVKFYQDYLANVLKAKNEGADIRGYLLWTFMDNFEWAEGYGPRFGIVYNDYKTQTRYPKDSALWWKEFLKS